MNKIFIEAQSTKTPECNFLKAFIKCHFPSKEMAFVCINGIGNLFNQANVIEMSKALDEGHQVLILIDADTFAKGYGFKKRMEDIENDMQVHGFSFPYFIYPNNQDDGEVETLMEAAARRDLHKGFFDCFDKYEKCVSGHKDEHGQPIYNTPNLKGKLHTYITAQKLSKKLRDKLGSGDWLFSDNRFWDLDAATLQPLKDFFAANLK